MLGSFPGFYSLKINSDNSDDSFCLIFIIILSHIIDLWLVESWWSNRVSNSRYLGKKVRAKKYTFVEQSFYHTRYFATGNKHIFELTGNKPFQVCTFQTRVMPYDWILVGRFIHGLGCGIATAISPVYLAEIAPIHLRGALGASYSLLLVQ